MAAYDLSVVCRHQCISIPVYPCMSYNEIMELIASTFSIKLSAFELQVYDERFKLNVDFDEEYVQTLRKVLPRTGKTMLSAEVLFQEPNEEEHDLSDYRTSCLLSYLILHFLASFL